MDCQWIKVSPSLHKGINVINQLENTKFEQFLRRIVDKLKVHDADIFTEDERQKLEKIFKVDKDTLLLAIKTIIYLYKRMLKYIFMPINLKNDLKEIGVNNEKSELIVKIWSKETKITLNNFGSEEMFKNGDSLNFSWKLIAELSSNYRKKTKVPKTYLSLTSGSDNSEIELTHPELYSLFLQFESIQNEIDNLM